MLSADSCNPARAVSLMHPYSPGNMETADSPPAFPIMPDAGHADLDAKGHSALLEIRASGEIDVTKLLMTSTVICDRGVKYSVKAHTTGAGTFKMALPFLITIEEQREIVEWVSQAHNIFFRL